VPLGQQQPVEQWTAAAVKKNHACVIRLTARQGIQAATCCTLLFHSSSKPLTSRTC
jgi:hypothetical protein